jgi:hypothetical protein
VKVSEAVESFEKQILQLQAQVKEERAKGYKTALRYLNSKTIGFIDGSAKILQANGVDGPTSFTIADQIWDMVKESTGAK